MAEYEYLYRAPAHVASITSGWLVNEAGNVIAFLSNVHLILTLILAINLHKYYYSFSEVEVVLQQIEVTTEQLVIPIIAYVGISINILVCFLLRSDHDMRISSKLLIYSFLICQMMYLASVAIYLKFKQLSFANDITIMNYITIVISISQMLATWILFLLVSESYRRIKSFKKKTTVLSLWNNQAKLIMLILLVLIYHLPYVPQIRVILYHLDKGFFSPCSNSIDDHWEFILPKKSDPVDTYYVIYFCFMYVIVTYALPYLLIGMYNIANSYQY